MRRRLPRRAILASLAVFIATTLLALSVSAQPANTHCPSGQQPQYVFGFKELHNRLGERMGDPVTCEFPDPNGTGDVHQRTSQGLAFWRKSTNTPTFTNGWEHWGLVAGQLVYWTGDSIDPPESAAPPSVGIDAGFVFINGRYVEPPYSVEVVDGAIHINGTIVRSRPEPAPPPEKPPADPKTAPELTAVAAARYRELGGQPTAEIRAELVELLRSYPATAEVTDDGTSITVTDSAGDRALLLLLSRPRSSMEAALAAQAARVVDWRALLRAGGVVLVSPGVSIQVGTHEAESFLGALLAIFDGPEMDRLDRLTDLVGDFGQASALQAAGPPPAGLRERLAAGPNGLDVTRLGARVGRGEVSPLTALGELRALALLRAVSPPGGGSHTLSRTPKTKNAYLFLDTFDWPALPEQVGPIIRAARMHEYKTIVYERDGCKPGGMTLANLLGTSGRAAILYVAMHGNPNALRIEAHCTVAARDAAFKAYKTVGLRSDANLNEMMPSSNPRGIVVTGAGIRNHWKDAFSIVMTDSCSTAPQVTAGNLTSNGLADAFKAREFIGTKASVCPVHTPLASLWDRIAGTEDQGTKRNVGDAFHASDLDKSIWRHIGENKTVLSPAVVSVEPAPGSMLQVGEMVQGKVTFDVEMDTSAKPEWVIGRVGPCAPRVVTAAWQDKRTLVFSLQPLYAGPAHLLVDHAEARSGDNRVKLDGNQDPVDSDHIGPNRDPYLWQVECVGAPTTGLDLRTPTPPGVDLRTPTPVAEPTPPPVEEQPTGEQVGLYTEAPPGYVVVFRLDGVDFRTEGLEVIPAHEPYCSYEHVHGEVITSLLPGPEGEYLTRTEHLGECGFGPPNFYLVPDPRGA